MLSQEENTVSLDRPAHVSNAAGDLGWFAVRSHGTGARSGRDDRVCGHAVSPTRSDLALNRTVFGA